jgi:hypothetical protein
VAITAVRVQVPLRVPNGTRGQNRPLVFFLELPKTSLALMMNCMCSVKVLVATLLLSSEAFFDNRSFSEDCSEGGRFSKMSFSALMNPIELFFAFICENCHFMIIYTSKFNVRQTAWIG